MFNQIKESTKNINKINKSINRNKNNSNQGIGDTEKLITMVESGELGYCFFDDYIISHIVVKQYNLYKKFLRRGNNGKF